MKLTQENKKIIDSLNYEELLRRWRFAPIGDPWFSGETGNYWKERMSYLKRKLGNEIHVKSSKKNWMELIKQFWKIYF